jgi:hypothetical protein
VAYSRAHEDFCVYANSDSAPTEYLLSFHAWGFAPPPAFGAEPLPTDSHSVFLRLPPTYPATPPHVSWQTPIYHPSIDPVHGNVNLGVLGPNWHPAVDLGLLCDMLVNLASFRNYPLEGPNQEAAKWAITPVGQRAIQALSGRLVHERINVETADRRQRMNRI